MNQEILQYSINGVILPTPTAAVIPVDSRPVIHKKSQFILSFGGIDGLIATRLAPYRSAKPATVAFQLGNGYWTPAIPVLLRAAVSPFAPPLLGSALGDSPLASGRANPTVQANFKTNMLLYFTLQADFNLVAPMVTTMFY